MNYNKSGLVSWRSPSNIAFVKYWGKKDRQLPMNPSISMTLSESYTDMSVKFSSVRSGTSIIKSFKLDGQDHESFKSRLEKFLQSIEDQCPFINNLELEISSTNSFPHSAGIASSASALSALAMCIVSIEAILNDAEKIDIEKASRLSRLGSGSACRSVYSEYAIWGEDEFLESTDDFAISFKASDDFSKLRDAILIVDSTPKKVSSSLGHDKMNNHPFASARFSNAKENIRKIAKAMKEGDWDSFGEVLELEALTLHALMMSSTPSFILLKPESLTIIEKVRDFRQQTNAKIYFTIDAGPNIHLIYPESEDLVVAPLLEELKHLCEGSRIIFDKIGQGPKLLNRSING